GMPMYLESDNSPSGVVTIDNFFRELSQFFLNVRILDLFLRVELREPVDDFVWRRFACFGVFTKTNETKNTRQIQILHSQHTSPPELTRSTSKPSARQGRTPQRRLPIGG